MQEKKGRSVARHIAILLFDGFALLSTSAIAEIFQLANEIYRSRNHDHTPYKVTFYSAKGAKIRCSSAIDVWTCACDSSDVSEFDAVFIADGPGVGNALLDSRIVNWLSDLVGRGAEIAPIGEGWRLLDAAVRNRHARTFSGGMVAAVNGKGVGTSLYDMADGVEPAENALNMVGKDIGEETAREISVRIRPVGGDGLSLIFPATREDSATEKIRAAAQWIRQNCDHVTSVREAVGVAAMSERNFLRRFKQEIGVTPSEYLTQARLDLTSRLLVETRLPIDSIAKQCGWTSGARLSRVFKRRFAATPTEFRARLACRRLPA
ncbi:GlxA family transcriptional regulator [Paraburkholderia sabiae]|uniref:Helix-turn-helix domain-containing protein n=1 Tax=Paraburkholderia sabiae TaxID=273251 RepID=A0ABU9QRY3_9BURK|nr:helix-turn-helix domain-containing protein [Paraburkholderia sabiae]WJZ79608.1 helix-turn-helix domain-containing protein [Paraburkholderia sabiae]